MQQHQYSFPHANHIHTHTQTHPSTRLYIYVFEILNAAITDVFDLLSFDDGQYDGVIAAWLCANPPANTHKNNDQKQSENH
jgi:hypothetical protein